MCTSFAFEYCARRSKRRRMSVIACENRFVHVRFHAAAAAASTRHPRRPEWKPSGACVHCDSSHGITPHTGSVNVIRKN